MAPTPDAPMCLADWKRRLPPEELEVYAKAGYARTFGAGRRPALAVVDVEYGFTGDDPSDPILTSIAKYRDSCGPYAWQAVPYIRLLLDAFRDLRLPVAFSHSRETRDAVREPRLATAVVDELAPRPGELVFAKDAASAFFETDLADWLRARDVDTVVVTGCATSGCVRASVVDAASLGFSVLVPEECVFDRALTPHLSNLFDMDAKYADVVSMEETLGYLHGLASGAAPEPAATGKRG